MRGRSTSDAGRYLDYAIEIRAVRQAPHGASPIAGKPPVVQVGEPVRLGGKLDTLARRFVGAPDRYRVWLVGPRQLEILLREDGCQNTLLYSAEGAGKTVLMAQWIIVQSILMLQAGEQGAIGATAPTHPRLGSLITAVSDLVPIEGARKNDPQAWGTFYTDANDLYLKTGHIIQFRQTQRASAAAGSPVQGYTWKRAAMDEAQDQVEMGAYPDIVARLRGARRSRIMATATAKDSPTWRNWRDALSSNWTIERLQYTETPFVWPEHWRLMKEEVSEREWQRRALAMDVGPERMLYHAWDRSKNLRPRPQLGAVDVTRSELAPYGANMDVLVGHDPGKLFDVSVLLKAYQLPGVPGASWWVVGEVTTEQSTTEVHAVELMRVLREQFGCYRRDLRDRILPGSPVALLRADPAGNTATKPDQTVYTTLRAKGFDVRPAAYAPVRANQTHAPKHGLIGKEERIDMVNTLLCNAAGRRRLFVDVGERGMPVAPKVVESFELSERDGDGDAEIKKKNRADLSHWTAALGYALWSLEKPRMAVRR